MSLFSEIKAVFAPQDPKRFSSGIVAPPNWFGELESKPKDIKGGAILTDAVRNVFEFGRYADEDIPEHLTDFDKSNLRKYNLDPEQPYYTKCKAYFSKNPYCKKAELSANSSGEYHEGISVETAGKVLAAFRVGLVNKPTF